MIVPTGPTVIKATIIVGIRPIVAPIFGIASRSAMKLQEVVRKEH